MNKKLLALTGAGVLTLAAGGGIGAGITIAVKNNQEKKEDNSLLKQSFENWYKSLKDGDKLLFNLSLGHKNLSKFDGYKILIKNNVLFDRNNWKNVLKNEKKYQEFILYFDELPKDEKTAFIVAFNLEKNKLHIVTYFEYYEYLLEQGTLPK